MRPSERVWGRFEAPGLRLASAGYDVRVGTLRVEFESKMSARGVPLGELPFSLDTLEVMDGTNGTPRMALRKWLLTQKSEEDASGMFRTNIVLHFADLARRDEHYGPGELELTHVNVRSQNGNLTAKAKIGVDGKNLPSFAGPMFLKRAVEGSAELRVPARIAHWVLDAALSGQLPAVRQGADTEADSAMRQVQRATLRPQLLQQLTTANILTREGDILGMHLVYRDAELLLNG